MLESCVSNPLINTAKRALLIATVVVAPATAQISEWRGERLEQMRLGFERAAERAEARSSKPPQNSDDGIGLGEIALPGQNPLKRLVQSGWNVIDISLTATIMMTPAGWFNDVTEPDKYRRGKQVVEGWLSTTSPRKRDARRQLNSSGNPLHHCVTYLQRGMQFFEKDVRDCSFVLFKRELIDGEMQAQRQMLTRVRYSNDDSGAPRLKEVFVEYLAPQNLVGRRIVYESDANNDKMLVREGSGLARHLTLKISPESRLAKMESQYSITDTGPLSVIQRLMTYLEDTIRIDPDGDITDVRYYQNSKVADRSCFAVDINFRERREGIERSRAIVFVDSKTYVPVYLAAFDWPTSPGAKPPLREEFIYTDLQFNADLEDRHFQFENKPE